MIISAYNQFDSRVVLGKSAKRDFTNTQQDQQKWRESSRIFIIIAFHQTQKKKKKKKEKKGKPWLIISLHKNNLQLYKKLFIEFETRNLKIFFLFAGGGGHLSSNGSRLLHEIALKEKKKISTYSQIFQAIWYLQDCMEFMCINVYDKTLTRAFHFVRLVSRWLYPL